MATQNREQQPEKGDERMREGEKKQNDGKNSFHVA
jgi:hypothetical protein